MQNSQEDNSQEDQQTQPKMGSPEHIEKMKDWANENKVVIIVVLVLAAAFIYYKWFGGDKALSNMMSPSVETPVTSPNPTASANATMAGETNGSSFRIRKQRLR